MRVKILGLKFIPCCKFVHFLISWAQQRLSRLCLPSSYHEYVYMERLVSNSPLIASLKQRTFIWISFTLQYVEDEEEIDVNASLAIFNKRLYPRCWRALLSLSWNQNNQILKKRMVSTFFYYRLLQLTKSLINIAPWWLILWRMY